MNIFEDINNLNSMLKEETLCKDKKFWDYKMLSLNQIIL